MKQYLLETKLLDYNSIEIQELIKERKWSEVNDKEKILYIYNYVRDEILFGYNLCDNLSSSVILSDGYGQCNTKGILFMSLLRAVAIPCRIHGFMINKILQKGAITGLAYKLSPNEILHSWVEVFYKNRWLNLEGFILDIVYLTKLQKKFKRCTGIFCGYGVATNDFKNPQIFWDNNDTYIQKEGITCDLGVFISPDGLFKEHMQYLNFIKKKIYENFVRHLMNRNVNKIRQSFI
ncbi:transglutaminase-like domain-containing protein [Clostridium estertheticum]|uniref:transglutaminase-like domain-containing protein n=1 Tax=Clostridium estertheticum TaxID=238834 RepID=UPI001C7DEFB7|nr:transglutaminase family protein [Clostridium estertheticum]MBX4266760.1 transglutaminase family protein [Clostridium estertheticum]WLC90549.1 transglutaminase family protein [Clostridium estertheticum]